MYLFFDTETTGLPRDWHAPVDNLENWPRMIQLAWLLYDDTGREVRRYENIIRPDGFEIPLEASNVHGITTERALSCGVGLDDALREFAEVLSGSRTLVAHNIGFDEKIAGAEFLRAGIASRMFEIPKICTMHSSTDFCQLPGKYGYKWPNLTELHKILFGRGFSGAHDALADVVACADCFFELRKRGIIEVRNDE